MAKRLLELPREVNELIEIELHRLGAACVRQQVNSLRNCGHGSEFTCSGGSSEKTNDEISNSQVLHDSKKT